VATGNYRLVVSSGEWVAIDTVVSCFNAQYSTYTMTGLEPTATYEATVSRLCDGEAESHAVRTVFTTPCAAVTEYPWMEDFNGTGNINDLTCWERYTGLYNDTAAFGHGGFAACEAEHLRRVNPPLAALAAVRSGERYASGVRLQPDGL
jgi:hypothetical protein